MSEYKICRICLRTETKVYKYDQFQLNTYFEEIMAIKLINQDVLPQYFCYECAALLHKYHKFKEKCCKGQSTLESLLWRGPITYDSINSIDTTELQSSMGLMAALDRIKCFNYVDQKELQSSYMYDESGKRVKVGKRNASQRNKRIKTETDLDRDPIAIKPESEVAKIKEEKEEKGEFSDDSVNDRDDAVDDGENVVEIEFEPVICQDEPVKQDYVKSTKVKKAAAKVKEEKVPKRKGRPPKAKAKVEKKKRVIKEKKEPKYRLLKNWTPDNEVMRYHAISAKRMKHLDPSDWNVRYLDEEEALKEFVAKANDPKYLKAPYKCTKCFLWFTKSGMLMRHIKLRHTESLGKYECRLCRCRYRIESGVREHMRRHYTKYHCLKCDLVCELETSVKVHDEYHKGVTRKCIRCNKVFKHSSTYYTHLRMAHRSEYICPICGESFISEKGINHHKRMAHIDVENQDNETQEESGQENQYCERCDIRFESQKAYDEHLLHSILHVEEAGKFDGLAHGSEIWKKQLHAKPKPRRIPTNCYQCGKEFNSYLAYAKHHTAEHPGTSLFSPSQRHICEICGASITPGSWPVHLNKHTREKVFSCDICGKEFIIKAKLKAHLVVHTGERPFGCRLCDKRFKQRESLHVHYRTFHLKLPGRKRVRNTQSTSTDSDLTGLLHKQKEDELRSRKFPGGFSQWEGGIGRLAYF